MPTMQIDTKITIEDLLERLSLKLSNETLQWKPHSYPVSAKEAQGICASERDEKVRWLVVLTKTNGFTQETLALSIHLFDRMLITTKLQSRYLTCIAFTCHYLAAKLIEDGSSKVPRIYELLDNSNCPNSVSEIVRMERAILIRLGWNTTASTPLDFICIFYALLVKHSPSDSLTQSSCSLRVLSLCQLCNRLSVCLQRHQLLTFRPSVLALALLNSTLRSRGFDAASALRLMLRITQLDASEVRRCQQQIDALFDFATKRSSISTMSSPGKSSKRKVSESQEDMYDGLKRLYSNDQRIHAQVVTAMSLCSTSVLMTESGGSVVSAASTSGKTATATGS